MSRKLNKNSQAPSVVSFAGELMHASDAQFRRLIYMSPDARAVIIMDSVL